MKQFKWVLTTCFYKELWKHMLLVLIWIAWTCWGSSNESKQHMLLQRSRYMACNLKTTKSLDCALIGECAVIGPNGVPSDMCTQRRLRSACAFSQSDQSLHCPHEETLHPWQSKMCLVKILIRLCKFAGWLEGTFSDVAAACPIPMTHGSSRKEIM